MCFGIGCVSKVILLANGSRFAYRTTIVTILLRYLFSLTTSWKKFCQWVFAKCLWECEWVKHTFMLCYELSIVLSWVESWRQHGVSHNGHLILLPFRWSAQFFRKCRTALGLLCISYTPRECVSMPVRYHSLQLHDTALEPSDTRYQTRRYGHMARYVMLFQFCPETRIGVRYNPTRYPCRVTAREK